MKITPKFYAKRKPLAPMGFSMEKTEEENLIKYLQQFESEEDLEITIKKKFKKRTSGQPGEETNFNGYFWGIVIKIIADEMGEYDTEYVKNMVLIQVGHFKEDQFGVKHAKETSTLSGGEFAELCSKIRMWATRELDCYIPEPNEAEYER